MKNNVKFSIIIPVYNVEKYLSQCINSVLNQKFEDYEIILINDGSTDNGGNICNEYAKSNKKVKVIHQNNQGLSAARNSGINVAQGEYVIFLDSDDYWYKNNVLSKIESRLTVSNADVLSFNFIKLYDNKFGSPYFTADNMPIIDNDTFSLKYLSDNNLWIACAWNKVIKRTLFTDFSLYFVKDITSEDIDWCLRLALYAQKFDYISDIVVCYRQRSGSISNSMTFKKLKTLTNNIDTCLSILDSESNDKKNYLKPYIGYVFATAFLAVASVDNKKERLSFINYLSKNFDVLSWSNSNKAKLLLLSSKVVGINLTIFLLRIMYKFFK